MHKNPARLLLIFLIILTLALSACSSHDAPAPQTADNPPIQTESPVPTVGITLETIDEAQSPNTAPKYVFLMIGDGMGYAQRQLATLYLQQLSGNDTRQLVMDKFPVQGVNTTYALDTIVTDSAAAGTALATGQKTNKGLLSVAPDGQELQTILEAAEAHGMATGLVTTTYLPHATPAAFGAHADNRNNIFEILDDYLISGIDFFAGGGIRYLLPRSYDGDQLGADGQPIRSYREDERDLVAEFEQAGYTTFIGADGVQRFTSRTPVANEKILAAFTSSHIPYTVDALSDDTVAVPSLAQMTQKATQALSLDSDGFFIMVEGGRIDHACHLNDAAAAVYDTIAFDEAVSTAYDFYTTHPDETLILVVADHETGGLWLPDDASDVCDMTLLNTVTASVQDKLQNAYEGSTDEYRDLILSSYGWNSLTEEETALLGNALADADNDDRSLYAGYDPAAVAAGQILSQRLSVHWSTFGHTSAAVGLSAIGARADWFAGYMDNAAVGQTLFQALGLR